MVDQLEFLRQLQTLDGELYRLRRVKGEKPRELAQAQARVAEDEARLKAAEERLTQLQLQQKEQEIELQTREGNVRKLQGQLFQVKTNKEYTAMQHQIDTLKADSSLLEDEVLKRFDAIDQASKERQAQQQRVKDAQDHLRQETSRVQAELATLEEQIAHLERQRQDLAPHVPPDALSLYERILIIREGLALVPLLEESCGGCNRRLPPQVVNEVHLQVKLVTCEHCNRILYKDNDEERVEGER